MKKAIYIVLGFISLLVGVGVFLSSDSYEIQHIEQKTLLDFSAAKEIKIEYPNEYSSRITGIVENDFLEVNKDKNRLYTSDEVSKSFFWKYKAFDIPQDLPMYIAGYSDENKVKWLIGIDKKGEEMKFDMIYHYADFSGQSPVKPTP